MDGARMETTAEECGSPEQPFRLVMHRNGSEMQRIGKVVDVNQKPALIGLPTLQSAPNGPSLNPDRSCALR